MHYCNTAAHSLFAIAMIEYRWGQVLVLAGVNTRLLEKLSMCFRYFSPQTLYCNTGDASAENRMFNCYLCT